MGWCKDIILNGRGYYKNKIYSGKIATMYNNITCLKKLQAARQYAHDNTCKRNCRA